MDISEVLLYYRGILMKFDLPVQKTLASITVLREQNVVVVESVGVQPSVSLVELDLLQSHEGDLVVT